MSSAHSMNARKCVHPQKPNPAQAFAHESSKVGGRGKREEEGQEMRGEERDKSANNDLVNSKGIMEAKAVYPPPNSNTNPIDLSYLNINECEG